MGDRKAEQVRELARFAGASRGDVEWICRTADMVDIEAGRILAFEGETVREVALVLDGIASSSDGAGEVLLSRGAYYNATEIISGRPCRATIEARTAVRLLVFGVREFRSLLDRIPSVRTKIPVFVDHAPVAEASLLAVS
jgi:CRP-like cAMP-binding protein